MVEEKFSKLDPNSVDSFVRRTIDRVYSMLYGIVGHKEDAEDLTQEVFVKALRAINSFRGDSSPETWLYRIAVNTGRDAIGRRQRERAFESGEAFPDDNSSNIELSKCDPANYVVESEEILLIREAVADLKNDWKEVITLVDIEDMKIEEASAILGIPEGTVKSRLVRGRDQLRNMLKQRMRVER